MPLESAVTHYLDHLDQKRSDEYLKALIAKVVLNSPLIAYFFVVKHDLPDEGQNQS